MHIFLSLLVWMMTGQAPVAQTQSTAAAPTDSIWHLYQSFGIENQVAFPVFKAAVTGYLKFRPAKPIVAIADLTLPSDQKRLFVLDLQQCKLLEATWVAHGRNSGLTRVKSVSNAPGSFQTSPGFYWVGNPVQSPKHGLALLLYGLQKGINDNARRREIILHGADYVGETFVKKHGRCGRSHGCPAVPAEQIRSLVPVLGNGSLLYIHTEFNSEI